MCYHENSSGFTLKKVMHFLKHVFGLKLVKFFCLKGPPS